MKLSGLIFLLLLSFSASASYLESCIYEAKVVQKSRLGKLNSTLSTGNIPPVVLVKFTAVIEDRGSHNGCDHWLDKIKVLELKKDMNSTIEEGEIIRLDHFYVNSFGPNGIQEADTWKLITERDIY